MSYSCNCGWIDWGHANPGGARNLLGQFKDAADTSTEERPYYRVDYWQESRRFGVGVRVDTSYRVYYDLSETQRTQVALAIFQATSMKFETKQGRHWLGRVRRSSFAETDLVSNLLGFYRAARGYSVPDVKRLCKVLDPQQSECVWDGLYGRAGSPGENREWIPVLHEGVPYCAGPRAFPAEFQSIKPASPGVMTYSDMAGPPQG